MHPEGNIFSILAFFIWVPFALWTARRSPPAKAAALLLVIPLLLLPERTGFDLPAIPKFEKNEIAIFWLLIGVLLFHRDRLRSLQLTKLLKLSIALLLIGNVATALLNPDPVLQGSVYMPGHTLYDAFHFLILSTFKYVLPFVLAAAMFSSPSDLRVLFRTLVVAALFYSALQLFELRMSPQLHSWVYGFHQHSMGQAMRGSRFRPMVFMHTGLALAMFTAVGTLAAAAFYKARIRIFRYSAAWASAYLWFILVLSRSLAAFLYTQVALPLILFTKPKTQFRVAALLALLVIFYPLARGSGLVPVEDIREFAAAQFDLERADSLSTRLVNEEQLLERADERFFFGWGVWCRACIFDSWSGREMSIRDGDWIITVGEFGYIGFLAKYLLLLLPIFFVVRRRKRIPRESDRRLLSGLALIVGFSVFDLLPNGNFDYLVFAFSGALFGCANGAVLQASRRARLKRERAASRRATPSAPATGYPS